MSDFRDEFIHFGKSGNGGYSRCRQKFIGWAKNNFGRQLSEDEIIEIYHDAIIIMLKNMESGRLVEFTASPCTYLIGIGKFLIPAYLRKRRRTDLPGDDQLGQNPENDPGPEKQTIREQDTQRLWKKVESLGDPCRTLLILTFKNGMNSAEIAEVMGYSTDEVVRQIRKRCITKIILEIWEEAGNIGEPCQTLLTLLYKKDLSLKKAAESMGLSSVEEAEELRRQCLGKLGWLSDFL